MSTGIKISFIVMTTSLSVSLCGPQAYGSSSSDNGEKIFSAYVRAEQEAFDDLHNDIADGICENADERLDIWDFCQDADERLSGLNAYLKKGRRIGIPENDWMTLKRSIETLRADIDDGDDLKKGSHDLIATITDILHSFKVHEPDIDLPLGYGPWSAGDVIDESNCATVLFKAEQLRKSACGKSRPRLTPTQKVETFCSSLDGATDFTLTTDDSCSIIAAKRPAGEALTKDRRLSRARECVLRMEQVFNVRR